MERWVKIYDKLLDWEWFTDSSMVHLFVYLLLKANASDTTWREINVRRGQLLTTVRKISADTGISLQTIRTCFNKLCMTGEIVTETTNKFTIITICQYERYQIPKNGQQARETDVDDGANETDTAVTQMADETETVTATDDEHFKKQFLSDQYWSEVMCMRHHLTPVQLKELIEEFFVDQQCRGNPKHNDLRDAKSHFNNWLIRKQQIITDNGSSTKNKSATDRKAIDRRGTDVPDAQRADYHSSF